MAIGNPFGFGGAVGGGGGGIWDRLKGFLGSEEFTAQLPGLLAMAGKAVNPGGVGERIGQSVLDQQKAQWLAKMLGMGGKGSKLTVDDNAYTIKGAVPKPDETEPRSELSGGLGAGVPTGWPEGPMSGGRMAPAAGGMAAINPFVPSSLGSAGPSEQTATGTLPWGISPETVAMAETLRLKGGELESQKLRDLIAMIGATKEDLSPLGKEHRDAVRGGYRGTIEDYRAEKSKTTNQKDYAVAVEQGYQGSFQDWIGWKARQGGTSININTAAAKAGAVAGAVADVKSEKWFTGTGKDSFAGSVRDHMSDADLVGKLVGEKNSRVKDIATINEINDYAISLIVGAGHVPLGNPTINNGVIRWKVRYSTGKEGFVSYGIKR